MPDHYTDADVQAARESIKAHSLDRFASEFLTDDARNWLAGFAARAALDAVSPAIAARALRDEAEFVDRLRASTSQHVAAYLRTRADEIEGAQS